MRSERYTELAWFVAVAEHGSITRAAASVGMSASQVSRTVTQLEARLGVTLLHRTTRRITLTEEGRALFARARASFAELDEAEAAVGAVVDTARGRLRVSLPLLFGHWFVSPLAARFAVEQPLVTLDLSFDDRKVDLVEQGFDLAIRIGLDDDPSLLARRLGHTQVVTVASPAYLARHAPIVAPGDLADHEGLMRPDEVESGTWSFENAEGPRDVRLRCRLIANSGFAVREAALHGVGVARLPDFIVCDELRAGTLVRLLPAWERDLVIAAVYPPGRYLAPKVRRFVDFLAEHMAATSW